MANFRSTNPLGTFYSPSNGVAVIKVDVPTHVNAYAGGTIAAPHGDGGVFVSTSQLVTAINRNWRNCVTNPIEMGLEIIGNFTGFFGASSDFAASNPVTFSFGNVDTPIAVPGFDMTLGNPQHGRETLVHSPVVCGTASQVALLEPGTPTDTGVNVYLTCELDWCFYAYRFWSKGADPGNHQISIPFAMALSFAVQNETDYGWPEDASPLGATGMFITSNWKVSSVNEMAEWNLATDFPGINADGLALNFLAEIEASFEFGADPLDGANTKVRSYNGASGNCEFTMGSARIVLPEIADALPAL